MPGHQQLPQHADVTDEFCRPGMTVTGAAI
jgi:hypothetical protein